MLAIKIDRNKRIKISTQLMKIYGSDGQSYAAM